ncbi:cell 5A endo-1,4-betaglucanase [Achlya hypogyna]|uniref:Cell 5A endo-1,4-betaglucanase n=1 Tax=Achlya hypogyna TaxID=1202772 RepID=A0A1V9Z723_ACHHY|nr:cell 5A endo-1,4-betaglucanase [Achlya hypogyna]
METPTHKYAHEATTPTDNSAILNLDAPILDAPQAHRHRRIAIAVAALLVVGAVTGVLVWQFSSSSSDSNQSAAKDPSAVNPTTAPTPAPTRTFYSIGKIQDGSTWAANEDNNPLVYPSRGCVQPNYLSKHGQIFVVGSDKVERPIAIKGINWFGMETINNIPFGLWTNDQNGTTLYEITAFLSRNNFNSVRLPLSVQSLLLNTPPTKAMVHEEANAAFDTSSYVGAVGSVVKALGSRGISVLLDLHNLNATEKGDAWFGNSTTADQFMQAMDVLTSSYCNATFWNVIGVDLKNEPYGTTWGDNGPKDFRTGAATIANRMLNACGSWLAFVEGNAAKHNLTFAEQTSYFFDWWGGGLRDAGKFPLQLAVPQKVVYSPHYYSPSVYPQSYLVQGGKRDGDVLVGYTEYDDPTLSAVVHQSSEEMFGYLRSVQDGALVLGEFGGLFALDAHEKKTTQRVTQNVVRLLSQPGYAGGYMWSLNPESGYEYNPSSVQGHWTEGLLEKDWVHVNMQYLNALKDMDTMPHLASFPCLT